MSVASPRVVLRSLVSCIALAIVVAQAAPAFAANIQTDLWVYQDGDTILVTGDGFGSLETVELVTTDPSGVEVDRGTTTTDDLGNLAPSYQFVLHATEPGIYDIAATGETSGATATTQFDPASHTITGKSPNAGNRPWFRTIAGGFDVTVAGGYTCSTGGSGTGRCASPSTMVVDALASDGGNASVALPVLASKTISSLSSGAWTTTFQFRSSPGAGQFAIPADGLFDVRADFTWNVVGGGTSTATEISDDHFGVDNVSPISSVTSISGTGTANVSASGAASDALSGLATGTPVHVEIRQGSAGGAIVVGTGSDVNPAGNGNWSYSTNSGPTAPGTYCVVSAATDRAGNVQSAVGSQCYTIAQTDTTAPSVSIQVATNGGTPNGNNGWYTTNVSGSVSATDTDSNISALSCSGVTLTGVTGVGTAKTASGNFSITTDGTTNLSCTATDSASSPNTSAPSTLTIKRDATAPVLSTRPAGDACALSGTNGWCRGTPTAGFSVTDATSGTSSPCVAAGGASCNFTKSTTTNGSAVTIASGAVTDLAGNSASSVDSAAFKIDSAAPVITTRPAGDVCSVPGLSGWCRGTQTAGFSVTDATAGISTPCVAAGGASCDFIQSTATNGSAVKIASGSVSDLAGNTASSTDSAAFKIDSQAPTVNATPDRSADSNGWYNHPVTVAYNGIDNGPSDSVTCDVAETYSGPDSATASETGSCSDAAGNSASDTFSFKYDGTGPAAIATPSRGADSNGWYNHPFSVSFSTSGTDLSDNVSCDSTETFSGPDDGARTISGTCTDDAGNSTTAEFHFQYDSTAPVITTKPADDSCSLPGNNGWCRGTQTAGFSASDATSGVDAPPCASAGDSPCDFTKSTATNGSGVTIASGSVSDVAGNAATSIDSAGFDIDSIAPTISAGLDKAPVAGWFNISTGAPSAQFTCSDGLSTIDTCPADHLFGEGSGQSFSGTAYDKAGNSASDGVSGVNVDLTAPLIDAALDRDPADSGWFNASTGAPSVTFLCSDLGSSSLASCPTAHLFGEGSNQSFSNTAYDNAGNSTSAGVSDVDVDLTAPVITTKPADDSCSLPGNNGWCRGTQTAGFSASDATSGVDAPPCASAGDSPCDFTKSTATNGSGVTIASGSVSDVAGNAATSIDSAGFDIDSIAPTISAGLDQAPVAGWFNISTGAPSAQFTCSDGLSTIDTCPADHLFGEGSGQSFSGTAYDKAGNSASDGVSGVNVDLTAPLIATRSAGDSCSLPGNLGWCRGTQTAGFSATDGTSGVAAPPCAIAGSSPCHFTKSTSTNGSAVTIASGSVSDVAGNTATSINSAAFKVDSVAPTEWVTGVVGGATYSLGSVPAPGCSQYEGLSGIATNTSLHVTGGTPNGVGTYTATCSGATDVAGNASAPASVSYNVVFAGLSGILQPVNPDNTSVFKRGQAIPVKFKLAGDEYTGFATTGWTIQEQTVPCTSFDGNDATLESATSNTPTTVFRYDASADQYIYNADMHDKTVGSCWNFKIKLDSGQVMYSAVFKLAK